MKLRNSIKMAGLVLVLAGTVAFAQPAPGGGDEAQPPQPPAPPHAMQPPDAPQPPMAPMPPRPGRPPMERAMGGHWWANPEMAEKLGISTDQKKQMEDIRLQHRLKLIDLNASLQKAEAIMEPMMAADQPDEGKILAQIDHVAQARAELEKANARMLLAVRKVLTPEQWKKLQELRPAPAPAHR